MSEAFDEEETVVRMIMRHKDELAAAYDRGATEFAEWLDEANEFGWPHAAFITRFLASRGTGTEAKP